MLQSLKPSPRTILRSRRRPSHLPSSHLSATGSTASSAAVADLSFFPLIDPYSELDLRSGEIAASFKDWFKQASPHISPLDQIYAALSSSPDDPSLDAALSRLSLRLSEDLVLRALSHRPHPSAAPAAPDDLLLLRLRFFDWSGRQSGYRHSRSAYHSIFRLLSHARLASVILDWLHLFSSARNQPHTHHSFLRAAAGPGRHPRFHDTLVVGYSLAGRPEFALHLFARMRFQGLDLDAFAYHVLLNSLVEADMFDFAEAVLSQIGDRGLANHVTACIKIKSLCLQGRLNEAEAYLRELMASFTSSDQSSSVNEHAVSTLIHALCRKGRFKEAGRMVEEFGSSKAYGIWLSSLLRSMQVKTAMHFLQCKEASEGYVAEDFHYNRLISMFLKKNQLQQVYDMLLKMMEEGISPDVKTMNATLCFFCKAGMVDVAIQLYNSRLELGFSPSCWVYEHLINALCHGGSVEEACRVLEESLEQGYFPGKQTFSILANLLCREGKLDMMRKLLDGALEKKIRPTTAVFARYISALCKAGQFNEACFVPDMVPRGSSRLAQYKHTYTSLIHAFIVMGRADVLPRLLIEMQEHGHFPSRHLYRKVLGSLCEMGMFDAVLDLLNQQLELKQPDPRTCYNYFIDGAAHSKKAEMARELYNRMVTAGIEPNMDTNILLLQGYLKSMQINDAQSFFYYLQEKRQPSNKLYNIFISGLCEVRKSEQAVALWREAREKGLIPSLQCYEDLVFTLCSSKDYDTAVKVLKDFRKTGRPVSSFLCNVLLLNSLKSQELWQAWVQSHDVNGSDEPVVASKGTLVSGRILLGNLIAAFSGGVRIKGNIDDLDEEIAKIFPTDIFTYNMLLRGLCMKGRMDSACNLLRKMCKKGFEPNRFSYDIIVHGFCKCGSRKDAERWMEDMFHKGFHPTWSTRRIYNNTP